MLVPLCRAATRAAAAAAVKRTGRHVAAASATSRSLMVWPSTRSRHVCCHGGSRQHQQQVRHMSFSFPGPRKLGEITKLPLLEKESKERIEEIWTEFHGSRKDAIGTTLDAKDMETLLARAKECPMFVFPVHRDGGYFMLISQFQGSHFLLTFLADYQANPGGAQPYMTISLFSDLLAAKGLGLVRADVTAQLSKAEGEHVLALLREQYLGAGERWDAVYNFNHRPEDFNFDTYISSVPPPP